MWRIRVTRGFSAAHSLKGQGGKCEEVHGHNYRVEVAIGARRLRGVGMVADFVEVRRRLDSILPDHRMLNEIYDFNPTAENLARRFYEDMVQFYPVQSVTVWESEGCCAEYAPG